MQYPGYLLFTTCALALNGPPPDGDHLGDNVWLGTLVVMLPGVTIGKGAVIGAGSVVTQDVPPFAIAAGNPARVARSI